MTISCPSCGATDLVLLGRVFRLVMFLGAARRRHAGYLVTCSRCGEAFCATGAGTYRPKLAPQAPLHTTPRRDDTLLRPLSSSTPTTRTFVDEDMAKQWGKPGP
jgi:hypothetical protein